MNHDPEMMLIAIDLLKKERDRAAQRAEKAEYDVSQFRYELLNVLRLHEHDGPSSMTTRIKRALNAIPEKAHD